MFFSEHAVQRRALTTRAPILGSVVMSERLLKDWLVQTDGRQARCDPVTIH